MAGMSEHPTDKPVFRDGRIHVCAEMCKTCVFRPGNRMHLDGGRLKGMVDASLENDSAIVCHSTLNGAHAVCRGFFDRHQTTPLQLAEHMDMLAFVDPDKEV